MSAHYIIAVGNTLDVLAKHVQNAIQEGYHPIGGVSANTIHVNPQTNQIDKDGEERVQYCQALLRS